MKTQKFSATVGIVPGYFHDNANIGYFDAMNEVGRLWQRHANYIFKATGCYVGAVISPSLTVYNEEWGCPEGGELTVSIEGQRNPVYFGNADVYEDSAKEILRRVALDLGQSTTQITFSEPDFTYINFADEEA